MNLHKVLDIVEKLRSEATSLTRGYLWPSKNCAAHVPSGWQRGCSTLQLQDVNCVHGDLGIPEALPDDEERRFLERVTAEVLVRDAGVTAGSGV